MEEALLSAQAGSVSCSNSVVIQNQRGMSPATPGAAVLSQKRVAPVEHQVLVVGPGAPATVCCTEIGKQEGKTRAASWPWTNEAGRVWHAACGIWQPAAYENAQTTARGAQGTAWRT